MYGKPMVASVSPRAPAAGRVGVEPFDVGYGAAFSAVDGSDLAVECEIVEDESFCFKASTTDAPYEMLAFVDGTVRTDARLTYTTDAATISGVAGSWAAGAVLVQPGAVAQIERVEVGRAVVFTNGVTVDLPPQGGWSWRSASVPDADVEVAMARLRQFMRDLEVSIAESMWELGVVTVLDGPLTHIRANWTTPIIGYVKTHMRPMLAPELWARVPELPVRQRTSVFQIRSDLYGAYLRVGDPGPWASPWGGIVRVEVPAGAGLDEAIRVIDAATGWLPDYASEAHRDPRAPVNLAPIAGLEWHIRRAQGDPGLAVRAVRDAVIELNHEAA